MWKSRTQLDQNYGSVATISKINDLHQESWGEQPCIEALSSFSDLEEQEDEISGRYMSAVVFAIACFTITGIVFALFLAFNMTVTSSFAH
ncbi:hypothetical protein N7478_001763 [Penicillium angulare]|uniref:uncharacterized protein n=1 Tax=Penicillium angulare TaxID=116970 RepID=UPI0025406684|nr:uncharacterized protein N7478_001763 [Penicillium angulare]KAJ5288733.1 hypothetical protein N7478_001763 [Penicillium angulare]